MAFVQAVVKLTTDLQFDGWLLNIEKKLTQDQVKLMVMLLKNLKGVIKKNTFLAFKTINEIVDEIFLQPV